MKVIYYYKVFAVWKHNIDTLVQDCRNSIADTLELLQFSTKPSILGIQ